MKSLFRLSLLLLLVGLLSATSAWASDDYYWNVQSGEAFVNDANNWLLNGAVPSVYPGDDDPHDDYVYVNTPGIMKIDSSHRFYNDEQVTRFYVGDAGGGGHVVQSGGDVRFRYSVTVGSQALAGSNSYYELSGGSLCQLGGDDNTTIGGKGSNGYMTISGGASDTDRTLFDLTSTSAMRIGYESSSDGKLTIKDWGKAALGDELRLGYGSTSACTGTIYMEDYAKFELGSTSKSQYIGRYAGSTGLFQMIENSVAEIIGSGLYIGDSGAEGQFKISDSAEATLNTSGSFYIAEGSDSTGLFEMTGGTATISAVKVYVGHGSNAVANFKMSGNSVATITTSDRMLIGDSGSSEGACSGTVDLRGSAKLYAQQVNVVDDDNCYGTVIVTENAMLNTTGSLYIGVEGGPTGIASMTVSLNGKVDTNDKELVLGRSGTQGTVTILDDAEVTVGGSIRLADDGEGTLNLDGGTLLCDLIETKCGVDGSPSVGTLNFNGGVLKALDTNADLITMEVDSVSGVPEYATQTLNVKVGGAVIDTNTFDVGINQALVEDSVSTGGGLTKLGDGTLTLGACAHSYTGDTVVDKGILSTTGNATFSDTGSLLIAEDAFVELNFSGCADTIAALYLGGATTPEATGTWGSSTSGAAHVSDYFKGDGMVQVVPEPSMLALLTGLSMLLMGFRKRRA